MCFLSSFFASLLFKNQQQCGLKILKTLRSSFDIVFWAFYRSKLVGSKVAGSLSSKGVTGGITPFSRWVEARLRYSLLFNLQKETLEFH